MSLQLNNKNIRLCFLRWGPALLVMALIFFFSSLPSASIPDFGKYQFSITKGGHALGYLILGQTFLYSLGPKKTAPWIALGLCLIYAISDEFHQSFVPGRSPSIYDVGIDTIGAFVGLLPAIKGYRRVLK